MKIKRIIKDQDLKLSDDDVTRIVRSIFKELKIDDQLNNKSSISISIRPTNETIYLFEDIKESLTYTNHLSVSTMIKSMLIDYNQLSNLKREIIYFKEEFKLITDAIMAKAKLRIHLDQKVFLLHPYCVLEALDDYGNYLLGYNEATKTHEVILIRKIDKIDYNGDKYAITEAVQSIINRYNETGVRFFSEDEIKTLKALTDKDVLHLLQKLIGTDHIKKLADNQDEFNNNYLIFQKNLDVLIDQKATYIPITSK
jgi:hypothetical protein